MRATPHLTQSNGGVIGFEQAARLPVRTVLSGPSTGVVGAQEVGRLAGFSDLITFDMGGTSHRCRAADWRACRLASEAVVHGYPIKAPMLDIHTVGAGGGSIAFVDCGGLLKVGPRSAGADPGPVCYGRGNTRTDRDRRQRRAADAEPDASAGRAHGGAAGPGARGDRAAGGAAWAWT